MAQSTKHRHQLTKSKRTTERPARKTLAASIFSVHRGPPPVPEATPAQSSPPTYSKQKTPHANCSQEELHQFLNNERVCKHKAWQAKVAEALQGEKVATQCRASAERLDTRNTLNSLAEGPKRRPRSSCTVRNQHHTNCPQPRPRVDSRISLRYVSVPADPLWHRPWAEPTLP
jgi:hypothetical protein